MKLCKIIVLCSLSLLLSACGSTASEKIPPDDTAITLSEDVVEDESEPESENDTSDDPSDAQTENSQEQKNKPEADNNSLEEEPVLDDCSIVIGDIVLSLDEDKEDILAKLEEAGLEYDEYKDPKEFRADIRAELKEAGLEYDKYKEPEEEKYDSWGGVDGWLQLYFLDDICVRIRVINTDLKDLKHIQTARGLHPEDTYARIVELYGDSYETHTYGYKGVYTIYRYSGKECICEFGIHGERPKTTPIYNIDIYAPNQFPIYDYGGELLEDSQ